ncbi:hypothetical protein BX589_10117 [Paraburkholderia fungorum]|jgi:hypothetical protein|nr:hypothetical protein BX589_10117 [Paraburkholderia fungorum]
MRSSVKRQPLDGGFGDARGRAEPARSDSARPATSDAARAVAAPRGNAMHNYSLYRTARLAHPLFGKPQGAVVGVKLLGLAGGIPAFVVFEGVAEKSKRLGLAHDTQLVDFVM